MKSKPQSKNSQKPTPPEPSLQQRTAQAQADLKKWAAVAADPSLSPEAAAAVQGLARSSQAELMLGQKALGYQDPNSDQSIPSPLNPQNSMTPTPQNS